MKTHQMKSIHIQASIPESYE